MARRAYDDAEDDSFNTHTHTRPLTYTPPFYIPCPSLPFFLPSPPITHARSDDTLSSTSSTQHALTTLSHSHTHFHPFYCLNPSSFLPSTPISHTHTRYSCTHTHTLNAILPLTSHALALTHTFLLPFYCLNPSSFLPSTPISHTRSSSSSSSSCTHTHT
jgi:hypothetical protein